MCFAQMSLQVGQNLACIQFGMWYVVAGVYIVSLGRYGAFMERYNRWALFALTIACALIYLVLLGMHLSGIQQYEWPNFIIQSTRAFIGVDYDHVYDRAKKMAPLIWSLHRISFMAKLEGSEDMKQIEKDHEQRQL